jgi:hypothetical protein
MLMWTDLLLTIKSPSTTEIIGKPSNGLFHCSNSFDAKQIKFDAPLIEALFPIKLFGESKKHASAEKMMRKLITFLS